jgi:16S rRNA (cytosine967-C5)-methyltransferase
MFAGFALGARNGETILDSCAGRGQKSSLIAEAVGDAGKLWATDVGENKLRDLRAEFTRLHLPQPRTAVVDWTKSVGLPPDFPEVFDRILIDAPCSGTGTLRHRPEITLRLKPADVERLAKSAERILRRVAEFASPTTEVTFVVCSVLRRECEEVVERVQDIYELAPFGSPLPQLAELSQFRLLPHVHGTDGFFLASLRRRVPR